MKLCNTCIYAQRFLHEFNPAIMCHLKHRRVDFVDTHCCWYIAEDIKI